MSRLTIDLTEQQYRDLKAVAALQGKTIKQYAVERLFPAEGAQDQAWEELREFIGKRVDAALADPSPWRTFDEVWPDDGSVDQATCWQNGSLRLKRSVTSKTSGDTPSATVASDRRANIARNCEPALPGSPATRHAARIWLPSARAYLH